MKNNKRIKSDRIKDNEGKSRGKKNIRERNSRKKDNRGSFTIEAAVIISFLVIVINIILVLTFFLYNRCSLERAAAMGALRGSQAVWENNSCRSQKADEGVDEILAYNLLGTDKVEKKITVQGNRISVALDMHIRQWDFHAEVEKKSVNPVLFIRNCRKLENLRKEQQ